MNVRSFSVLLVFLWISLGSLLSPADPSDSPISTLVPVLVPNGPRTPQQALEVIEETFRLLKNRATPAGVTCNEPEKKLCTMRKVCQDLRESRGPNASLTEIFRSPNGETIDNEPVFQIFDSLDACRVKLAQSLSSDESAKNLNQQYTYHQNEQNEKSLKFFEALKAAPVSQKVLYTDINVELTQMNLKDKPKTIYSSSKEGFSSRLDQALGRLKPRRLDPHLRELWLDSVDTSPAALQTAQSIFRARLSDNPFRYPDLTTDVTVAGSPEKLSGYQDQVKKAEARADATFVDVKAHLLSQLNKMKEKSPSEASKWDEMITRINTIQLLPSTSCGSMSASYYPSYHGFSICKEALNLPRGSLFFAIAHEMAHAIDPCNLSYPLLEVKSSAGSTMIPFPASLQVHHSVQLVPSPWPLASDHVIMGPVVSKGIPSANYPLKDQVNCLKEPSSVGAQAADENGLSTAVGKMTETFTNSGGYDVEVENFSEALEKNLQSTLNDHGACNLNGIQSQLQEASADWLATETLGDKLDDPTTPPEERKSLAREAVQQLFADQCVMLNGKLWLAAQQFLANAGCTIMQQTSLIKQLTSFDPHPEMWARKDRIQMANPTVRESLNCGGLPFGVKYCDPP